MRLEEETPDMDQNKEFEAIKRRHETCQGVLAEDFGEHCHTDRATLITLVEAERARADKAEAELAEERAANVALKDLCLAAGDLYRGGGVFPMKGAMALRLLKAGALARAVKGEGHTSDCATHNMPAMPAGECDCKE